MTSHFSFSLASIFLIYMYVCVFVCIHVCPRCSGVCVCGGGVCMCYKEMRVRCIKLTCMIEEYCICFSRGPEAISVIEVAQVQG